MYSIILIDGTLIDVTAEELKIVQKAISNRAPIIMIGPYSFAAHQFCRSMPMDEAHFMEKMRLREKGMMRCRKGVIHKLSDPCSCKDTGEVDPRIDKAKEYIRIAHTESLKLN